MKICSLSASQTLANDWPTLLAEQGVGLLTKVDERVARAASVGQRAVRLVAVEQPPLVLAVQLGHTVVRRLSTILLHIKLNNTFHPVLTSPRRGSRLPKPTSPACSTANCGLRTGVHCYIVANLTCLAKKQRRPVLRP